MEVDTRRSLKSVYLSPLLAGAVAGLSVDIALYPLDTLKTRLQSAQGFQKAGGFNGVYRGLLTVVTTSVPTASLFFVSYEATKTLCEPLVAEKYAPFVHMLAGSVGEVLACVIRVPTEIAKQRKQTYVGTTKRSSVSILYDLPNDMENYMEYHIMGSVSKVRMKSGCIPTKFECQPVRKKRTNTSDSNTIREPNILKKIKLLIDECENIADEKDINKEESMLETSSRNLDFQIKIENIKQEELDHTVENKLEESLETAKNHKQKETKKTADKIIQVYRTHKFRSKAIQTDTKLINNMASLSGSKPNLETVCTSPFMAESCSTTALLASKDLQQQSRQIFIIENQSDSDMSYTLAVKPKELSPSISHQTSSTSDSIALTESEEDIMQDMSKILEFTLLKIRMNPDFYIGVPENCYYIIDLIEKNTSIPTAHILMCLKKIKLNSPFRELADDFSITQSCISEIFLKSIPVIAGIMRPFIVKLYKDLIKTNLPLNFNIRHNITCIIDCLEIQVEISESRKLSTVKYIVSYTPNGLVNFISRGYLGNITDTDLVELCGFIECLQPDMCVMVYREFKHLEEYLIKNEVQLLRPLTKLSKCPSSEYKEIDSLRTHVESVFQRLKEFSMLKRYACINYELVEVLDDIVSIACGLINLQDSVIK